MAAFEEKKQELAELGVGLFAASADDEGKAAEVAESGVSFPLAWGVTREIGDRLGAWWDERRGYIQPAEFVLRQDGRIVHSSYSSGPLARTQPDDVASLVRYLNARAEKKK